jgi:signal transduction histidine kinase/CheY-like chemotaxis protein
LIHAKEVMKKRRIFIVMLLALVSSWVLASCTDSRHGTPGSVGGVIDHIPDYHAACGGTQEPVLDGSPKDISKHRDVGLDFAAAVFGGFIVISVYYLILFAIRRKEKTHLWSALLGITGALWIFISRQHLISLLFPALSRNVIAKIEYVCLILALIICGRLFKQLFKEEFSKYSLIVMEAFGAVLILLFLLTDSGSHFRIVQAYYLAALAYIACMLWMGANAVKRRKNAEAIMSAAGILMLLVFANDIAQKIGIIIFDASLSPYGIFIFILAQAGIALSSFFILFKGEEEIAGHIRLKAERIEESEKHLNDIYNSISSMIIITDGQGRVVSSNQTALKSFPGLFNSNVQQFIWNLDLLSERLKADIKNAFASQVPFEARGKHINDSEGRYCNISLYPCRYELSGGAVLRIDDVTEFEKKDEQFKHAERMEAAGTLAGGLAHDFNNILTGITGTISFVNYSQMKDEKYVLKTLDRLTLIENAAGKAVTLVNRIMALAKRQDFVCAGVDLNLMMKNVVNICRDTFDKSVDIILECYHEDAFVYADPTQLEQVMINLCMNANHAMTIMRKSGDKWGGVLTISIKRIEPASDVLTPYPMLSDSYCWAVDISDTGVGIDDNTKKRIFEPFFTTKDIGTGLGLVMVLNIVQQHGGVVEVKSDKGRGTDFRIILPHYSPGAVAVREPHKEDLIKGEGLILLAEEDDILKKSTRDILGLWGYEVAVADDGVEALRFFKKRHKSIKGVVMNLSLPRISGKELYKEIRRIDEHVRVVAVSGIRPDMEMLDALRRDDNGLIELPYSMMELLEKCRDIFFKRGVE